MRSHQLDVATVPLALVADQYFAYVRVLEAADVELAADYLVIAATLVYLKSKSLLPPLPPEFVDADTESPEEVEDRLRRRLVAYSRYRAVSEELAARRDAAEAYAYRDAGDPGTEAVQRYRLAPERLAKALATVLAAAKPERRTIVRERFTIGRQMEFVLAVVRARGRVEFDALCRDFDRGAIVATFLAVLELIRQRRIDVAQPSYAEPFAITPTHPSDIHSN